MRKERSIARVQGQVAASHYITPLLYPKSEKATEEESRKSRILDLLFHMAQCLRSPEIEAMFEILKLRVDELRLVEARDDEWRGVGLLFSEARWHRSPIRVNKSKWSVEFRRVATSKWNREAWRERVGIRKFGIMRRGGRGLRSGNHTADS